MSKRKDDTTVGMLFDMDPVSKKDMEIQVRRRRTCDVCPLQKLKRPDKLPTTPVDIVVITDNSPLSVSKRDTGYSTYHAARIECGDFGLIPDEVTLDCCGSRKANLIAELKPKIVLVAGQKNINDMDDLFGLGKIGFAVPGYPMPTSYKGHSFWLILIEDNEIIQHIGRISKTINYCINNAAVVEKGNDSGIEFVTSSKLIDAAFNDLLKNPVNAYDIETKRYRPYYKDSKILSIAIGTKEKTFGFPLFHSMTPSKFNPNDVLNRLPDLFTKCLMVAQNSPFDLEWLVHKFGYDFAYLGKLGDTMAQAYVLKRENESKSLDSLVRRTAGIRLKAMTGLNAEELDDLPLEIVLKYNCRDTKYTEPLWHAQNKILALEGLTHVYEMQMTRIPAIVCMQVKGLDVNFEFVERETAIWKKKLEDTKAKLRTTPVVQKFEGEFGKYFNPASPEDVAYIHHSYLGVPKTVTSFDEPYLAKHPSPFSEALLEYRGQHKIYSTTLVGLNPKDTHHDAGKHIFDDGRLHTTFNTMKIVTARLSSEGPNVQNQLKRDGMEYMRNIIKVMIGRWMLSIDQGQIEYKMIAALSRDMKMINALLNKLDVHASWANWCIDNFGDCGYWVIPDKSIPCTRDVVNEIQCDPICYKCWFKNFRNRAKNGLVFPRCFGSGAKTIGRAMGISDEMHQQMILKEFEAQHPGVVTWHRQLQKQMDTRGYVENAFGRRFYGPIRYNQLVNYPIQSTMADLVNNSMAGVAEEAVRSKVYDLIPILNVHDDLSYDFPDEHIQDYLSRVLPIMLDTRKYLWLPVPLTVEVSIGKSWGNLTKFGEFSSEDLYGIPGRIKVA